MWTIELAVIGVMIALNSVFAAYEIALASVSLGQLQAALEDQKRGASAALRMKQGIEASLAVIQLGITLVGVVAAATGGASAEEAIEPWLRDLGISQALAQFLAILLIVAPLTVVTILLGELVPKVFALRNKERIVLLLSPIMEWFSYSVWPAVWFFERSVNAIVKLGDRWKEPGDEQQAISAAIQELHGAAALARLSRLIGSREEGIIVSASRLSTTPLRKVMLPATYIDMLDIKQTLNDALIAAHMGMHTRYPVTKELGNPQSIVGYVNFKDIVAALRMATHKPSVQSLVRDIQRFDADLSAAECLETLIRERNHIGLVHHQQKVIGLITLEDIIEELVGEIHDELDRMPTYLNHVSQGWIAGGFVSLQRLKEIAEIELEPLGEKPIYTLNDWISERLGRPPQGGDRIQAENCVIVVRKTRKVLVQEAFIAAHPESGPASEQECEAP